MTKPTYLILMLTGVTIIMGLAALSPVAGPHALVAAILYCLVLAIYFKFQPLIIPTSYGATTATEPHAFSQSLGFDKDDYHDEMSLREQARLADGFGEAVLLLSREQRIVYANPAARSLLAFQKIGMKLSAVIVDPDIHALATEVLNGGKPEPVSYHIESPIERHIRVVGSPIMNEASESSRTHRAILIFYDISDIIRMNTMRADFLANASHELKTPVASLLGYIETLRGHAKGDAEAQETFLGIMQQQAERMQRLIDDLLSLRRIEMVEHIEPTETADLFLAARAAIEAVKPLASSRDIKLKYNGPKEALVYGSQDELVQLILNLLDNAVAFTPAGEVVKLNLELVDHWTPEHILSQDPKLSAAPKRRIVVPPAHIEEVAILRIRDVGPGFPREHLPRIGERFYKVSDVQSNIKRGTGLGLAIVKHIMRRHRGGLYLESMPGAGSEFTILLPRSDG